MPADINSPVRVAYKKFPEKLVNHSDHDWVNWREADMNTRWIILFSFFYLLLLNNQAEASPFTPSKPIGKRRFPLERIVQVCDFYWVQRGWLLWKFVKVKFLLLFLQHQDPGEEITKPTESYSRSRPVGREVRQKEVSRERAYLAVNGKHSAG